MTTAKIYLYLYCKNNKRGSKMLILLGFLCFIVGILFCIIGAKEMSNRKSKKNILLA